MDNFDFLIKEISNITGLSYKEVEARYSKDDLIQFIEVSKCEPIESITLDNKIPKCPVPDKSQDPSDYSDLINTLSDLNTNTSDFDSIKCVDSIKEVNDKIEKQLEIYDSHNIILSKLIELKDNIKPLEYYYLEKEKHLALILNEFKPALIELRRLQKLDRNSESIISGIEDDISSIVNNTPVTASGSDKLKNLQKLLNTTESEVKNISSLLLTQGLIINKISSKYKSFKREGLTSFMNGIGAGDYNRSIDSILTPLKILRIRQKISKYSEYIKVNIHNKFTKFSDTTKTPVISFKVKFQNIDYLKLEKDKMDDDGNRYTVDYDFKIKESKLLERNSFFKSFNGYKIKGCEASDESSGGLYTKYYNLLNDPINNFFTLNERGLGTDISTLDPSLTNSDIKTKDENGKSYYISDINKMHDFNSKFNDIFKIKSKLIHDKVVKEESASVKRAFEDLAQSEVEILAATARLNTYLPEESKSTNTLIDKMSESISSFIKMLNDLDSEIIRINKIIEENTPNVNKIKDLLKSTNSKCFKDIPDDDENICPDVKAKLGFDPFFKHMDSPDPSLPNFSQMCYWAEFAKLLNIQGLFPIPDGAGKLRYWPVGLTIPAPSGLIKIPLPIIWLPLINISTPSGVLVLFLTINGLFISPVMFFMSSSGYKQHIMTIKGSTKQFGYDKDMPQIKPTIQIPLMVKSAKDMLLNGKIDPYALMDKSDLDNINRLTHLVEDSTSSDNIKSKAKKEVTNILQSVVSKNTPDSKLMNDVANIGEDGISTVKEIKRQLISSIDAINTPDFSKINDLINEANSIKDNITDLKNKAIDEGNYILADELNDQLGTDGLDIDVKIKAISDTVVDLVSNITYPKIVIPKNADLLDPKLPPVFETINKVVEEVSKLNDSYYSLKSMKLSNLLVTAVAKYKDEINESLDFEQLNIEDDFEKIKGNILDTSNTLIKKVLNPDVESMDDSSFGGKMVGLYDNIKKSDPVGTINKNIEKFNVKSVDLSNKMDAIKVKQLLSFGVGTIGSLSGFNVDFNPFKSCCSQPAFDMAFNIPPVITVIMDQAMNFASLKISKLTVPELKIMFNGKLNITPDDLRLALVALMKNIIPDSLMLPFDLMNLKSASLMFSGIQNGLTIPELPLQPALGALQLKSKITIDGKILKPIVDNALSELLSNILNKEYIEDLNLPISLDYAISDISNIQPVDIKNIAKGFINSIYDEFENKILPIFEIFNILKSAKGISLNPIESSAFKIAPYGPAMEILFIAKGLVKMNLSKSLTQYVIDPDILKAATLVLESMLKPIVTNPTAYILVAIAGVANQLDVIRLIHPVLSADDIPPWERLSLQNILFLVFLDEFITNGADKLGFYRNYI